MTRIKIDYGIDLGTTNSAISRIEDGISVIKKTDTLKDTMPSCVFFNKKKAVLVGDGAISALNRDTLNTIQKGSQSTNGFLEFKRTMGTDEKYYSSNLGKELSSEELSAEILKGLKSFITDENVEAAIITIPAAFKNNQIDATHKAAQLAGFKHVEMLQEPVAAALAYGLNKQNSDAYWLVFDFGGGTFDAAILKVEDGIMKVIDTEGDNHLGGKNLDLAILDEIIFPYVHQNFNITSLLEDDEKLQIFRTGLKSWAEEAKIQMSFNNQYNILSDLGELGEDDDGEEIELDITITKEDMRKCLSPIFQKAINLAKLVLSRNNLTGDSLDSLILVGGPTYSPILREMLTEQIRTPDTSVDPMTVVSRGAAIYASSVDLSTEVQEQTRDKTKIQLDLGYEATSVETEEFISVKISESLNKTDIPEDLFIEISRTDKSWGSPKIPLTHTGDVIDIQLVPNKTNTFSINLYTKEGHSLPCEPNSFSIIQGIGGIGSMQVLPYNFGIETLRSDSGKVVFSQIQGLERNKSLPVIGTKNALKTPRVIRPGIKEDFISIPLYQGEHESDGTRAIYNEHVYDIIISGNDLPSLLPANSDVDLTITIDKSQKITVSAYFPYLDYTAEIQVPVIMQSIDSDWLTDELQKAEITLANVLNKDSHNQEVLDLLEEINTIQKQFSNNPNDTDTKQGTLASLRKILNRFDKMTSLTEWPTLEKELYEEFEQLETSAKKKNNTEAIAQVNTFKEQMNSITRSKNSKLAKDLLEQIKSFNFTLNLREHTIGYLIHLDRTFNSIAWKNSGKARALLDKAYERIQDDAPTGELVSLIQSVISLMPDHEQIDISAIGNNGSILIE